MLGWGIRDFAKEVGINFNTVVRFEDVGDTKASIMRRMEDAFARAGIEFRPDGAVWHSKCVADPVEIVKAA
jgi:hypothetical protein